jgi:prepilin-type N-terminal cleavage/methylation domain-containing protein
MKSKLSHKGFTLLEILLVVGIVAVLAGIVIIAINPSRQLATVRNTQRASDLKLIYNAVTQFYIDKSYYPGSTTLSTTSLKEICNTGSVSATDTAVTGGTCSSQGLTNISELVPVYLTAIPVDPSGASSTMTLIPTTYAASNGTGYKIMKTIVNRIVEQAPLAELNVPIVIGNIDPCLQTPSIGTICSGGGLYGGSYNGSNYIVAATDGGLMNQTPAIAYCQGLGSGWHLPSPGELQALYPDAATLGFSTGPFPRQYYLTTGSMHNAPLCINMVDNSPGSCSVSPFNVRCLKTF